MAGVGKLLKTAQKMQKSIETLQAQLEAREIEVSAGGGAVKVKISAAVGFTPVKKFALSSATIVMAR